jgi:septum formation protein
MIKDIILASQSGIRKKILQNHGYNVQQVTSGVDEEEVKLSLKQSGATCLQIAKNLAELKANRISAKYPNMVVIGADQVLDLDGENLDKPKNIKEAEEMLNKLNNKKHYLHSAVCVSRSGSMISNFHNSSSLTMKNLSKEEIKNYIEKRNIEKLKSYGVYQIEENGKELFCEIEGNEDSIMGLPMDQLKPYLDKLI